VARRALAVSPSVKEKRLQLKVAKEKINQTMIQFFPKLSANASYTYLSKVVASFPGAIVGAKNPGALSLGPCPGNPTTQCVLDSGNLPIAAAPFTIPTVQNNWSFEGHLSIPLSDYLLRVNDAAAASKAGSESARIAIEAQKLQVAAQAKELYFNWLRSRGQVSIAKSAVERTRARLQDARASFEVGAISKADLLRIEALVANTELRLNGAETAQAMTTGQLAILMEDWHPNYRVGEGIPDPTKIPDETRPVGELIAAGQSRRLEVRSMDESVSGLKHGASATRAGALPRLDGFGDVFYANPNQRYFPPQSAWHTTWDVGVRATWVINDTFSQSSAAREMDANAASTIEQRRMLLAGVASEVLTSYLDMQRARAAVSKQQTALAAAEEGYRVTTDLFKAGRATSTELIESESQLLEAKLGDVDARIDLAVAAIGLRHSTAGDVGEQKSVAGN
jgi:outer membrane protein TolC